MQRSIGPDALSEKPLSQREEQIVKLAIEGRTNEEIGRLLGLSLSTVNSYWLRIRMKLHGESRTAVVERLIRERAKGKVRTANALAGQVALMYTTVLELRTVLSLLQSALDQLRATAWSTDGDLRVSVIAGGETQDCYQDMAWSVGNTIHEVFNTTSNDHPAVAAHISALRGTPAETRLDFNKNQLLLSVQPLTVDDGTITGCIGVMARLRSGM